MLLRRLLEIAGKASTSQRGKIGKFPKSPVRQKPFAGANQGYAQRELRCQFSSSTSGGYIEHSVRPAGGGFQAAARKFIGVIKNYRVSILLGQPAQHLSVRPRPQNRDFHKIIIPCLARKLVLRLLGRHHWLTHNIIYVGSHSVCDWTRPGANTTRFQYGEFAD